MITEASPLDATTQILRCGSPSGAPTSAPGDRRSARGSETSPLEHCRRRLGLRQGARLLHLGLLPHLAVDEVAWPFDDGSVDSVISLFDLQAAPSSELAACELMRVIRSGGGLAVAAWTESSYAAVLFDELNARSRMPWQRGELGPDAWSSPERISGALGDAFELRFEYVKSRLYAETPAGTWSKLFDEMPSLRALASRLGGDALAAARNEFLTRCRARFGTDASRPQTYLVTLGKRR